MKKIYFAGSIRGGRDDATIYKLIIDLIGSFGCQVLTEHIGLKTTTSMGEAGRSEKWIYDRDNAWLKQADGVIAEVTTPSLGVGYEIAKAEGWGKPVLALYRPVPGQKLSAMIAGSPNVRVCEYSDVSELASPIKNFIDKL